MKESLNRFREIVLEHPITIFMLIGLLLAMLYLLIQPQPSYQDKINIVYGNLRTVSSNGQQYILENSISSVSYYDINKLIKDGSKIKPVLGENYKDLVVREEGGFLIVTLSSGETISFQY